MKKWIAAALFLVSFSWTQAQEKPQGLKVNDQAPVFTAMDQSGKTVSLTEELKKGDVVLVFYRGFWCPYCNKYLMKLEDSMQQIKAKGAMVIAISPEVSESIAKTVDKTKASFPILHDEGLKIMNDYKVGYQVDAKTVEKYKTYQIDFDKVNGSNSSNLPVPAVYIINQEGKITYSFFNPDYSKRASVKDILAHL